MPAESEWVVSWLVSHVLAFRSPILCVSFAVRCHRPCMGSAAGGRLVVLAAWAEGDARLLPGRPGSGGDSPCLVIAGIETADQMLSCGWLGLVAHPVRYVLADHDAGEVDVRRGM